MKFAISVEDLAITPDVVPLHHQIAIRRVTKGFVIDPTIDHEVIPERSNQRTSAKTARQGTNIRIFSRAITVKGDKAIRADTKFLHQLAIKRKGKTNREFTGIDNIAPTHLIAGCADINPRVVDILDLAPAI